jgi:large subunit ribosomal protein L16
VKPGRIMFEIDGVPPEDVAHEALRLGVHEAAGQDRFVQRIGE